jgi:hypothetical protein
MRPVRNHPLRAGLVAALVLALAGAAGAADFTVEDWTSHAIGTKGVPAGWQTQRWGSPRYDFAIVANGAGKALHMKSANEGSTIVKDVKGKVNLTATPILEWTWKVTALPKGGNSCRKATDDQAAQVFVAWPRFPEAVRSRIIGYVWDSTVPVGTICRSEKSGTVTYVVVRSGAADLGKWLTERRNVVDDFRRIYEDDVDAPGGVSVAIDSNDTQSVSESFVGPILFRRP